MEWPKEMEWPGDMGQELTKEEAIGWNACLRRCADAIESVTEEELEEEIVNAYKVTDMSFKPTAKAIRTFLMERIGK